MLEHAPRCEEIMTSLVGVYKISEKIIIIIFRFSLNKIPILKVDEITELKEAAKEAGASALGDDEHRRKRQEAEQKVREEVAAAPPPVKAKKDAAEEKMAAFGEFAVKKEKKIKCFLNVCQQRI